MPVKPNPCKRVCPNCGWTQVIAPESDVILLPKDIPQYSCPKCGTATVQKPLNIWDAMKLLRKTKLC